MKITASFLAECHGTVRSCQPHLQETSIWGVLPESLASKGNVVIHGSRNRGYWRSPKPSSRQPHLESKCSQSLQMHSALTHWLPCPTQHDSESWQRCQVAALHSAGEAGMNTKSVITWLPSVSPHVKK